MRPFDREQILYLADELWKVEDDRAKLVAELRILKAARWRNNVYWFILGAGLGLTAIAVWQWGTL